MNRYLSPKEHKQQKQRSRTYYWKHREERLRYGNAYRKSVRDGTEIIWELGRPRKHLNIHKIELTDRQANEIIAGLRRMFKV